MFFLVIEVVDVVYCCCNGVRIVVCCLSHRAETHETSSPQSSTPHITHSVKLKHLLICSPSSVSQINFSSSVWSPDGSVSATALSAGVNGFVHINFSFASVPAVMLFAF